MIWSNENIQTYCKIILQITTPWRTPNGFATQICDTTHRMKHWCNVSTSWLSVRVGVSAKHTLIGPPTLEANHEPVTLYQHTWTTIKFANSLLNTTVVAFKVFLWEAMHRCQRLVHPSKQFWKWFCGMTFRASVVLLLMSSMSSKCLPFNISYIFGNR